MTIKATFREILTAKPALDKLASIKEGVSAKTKIRVGIILDRINIELEIFANRRDALLEEYGVQLDDGSWSAKIEDIGIEKNKAYTEVFETLLKEEAVINANPIPLTLLESISEEHDPLNIGDYMTLIWLIDMPDE